MCSPLPRHPLALARGAVPPTHGLLHGIVLYADHPEYVVAIYVHVIVMDLLSEGGRSNRTGVQVKSNKGERGFMFATIDADEFALAKPHVCLKRERRTGSTHCVSSGSAAADVCKPYETVEVRNLRGIVDICQRCGGI